MGNLTKNNTAIKNSWDDKIFFFVNNSILFILFIAVLYPILYIFSASFSDPNAVITGKVVLFPVGFNLRGYEAVFQNPKIIDGYKNTIINTVLGTSFNLIMTILAAYPLSRENMVGRQFFMYLFTFTMLFNGGLIPNYLLIQNLGLINTRWSLIIPGAISVYHLVVAKTFFQTTIPDSLHEAATIDGCTHFNFLLKIVLPLSKPILAVLVLMYAVIHWNAYFDAFIYIKEQALYPLQLVLRDILIQNAFDPSQIVDQETLEKLQGMAELLKYAMIIVASVPVWILYPFVQKHFVKGVMIGAIKG
jgi:putative aldouronate transport system permease protein